MDYPGFDDARTRFVRFLASCSQPVDLLWLTRDDVTVVAGKLFVNSSANNGEAIARERYTRGVAARLGVCLSALVLVGGRCGCAVYVPKDKTEAEYALMPNGLKLRVNDRLFRARPVRPIVFDLLKRLELRTSVWEDALHELGMPNKGLALDAHKDARQ